MGNYELSAIVTDSFGIATTSAAVAVTAIANVPPTVSLTGPANGTTMKVPGSFTLTADAASTTSAIAKVDFYAIDNATNASTLIGTATQAPYTANWSNVPLGDYTLSAVATDTLGAVTTSSQVSVTVNTGIAQAYYIHADHLDTPRQITDTSGNVVWQWDNTDPFGNNVPNENPTGLGRFEFNERFAGQYFDKETGLHYNFYRDGYNPEIGAYTQSDPIGVAGGINTYTYVNGNPLSFTDPYGLVRWGDVANSTLGLLGAGMGTVLGGALVAAPTGVSQVVGAAVLTKSLYSMGTSSYNLTRAFSDNSQYDIPSNYQTLLRVAASALTCSSDAQKVADAAELALDFASGRVTAGFARNPSGYLRNPVGYPPINSNQFTHPATFSQIAPKNLNTLSEILQGTQTIQYGAGALQ